MPAREQRSILAILAGVLAMVLAWIEARGAHAALPAFALRAALVVLLVGPAAVLPHAFRSRQPAVALMYALFLGGAFAAAGGWLERADELVLAGAYYAVPGVFLALAIGLVPIHWRDRRRDARATREDEARARVGRIQWRLWTGSAPVADAEIREAIEALAAAAPADDEEAAALLFSAVAPIAGRRPALAEPLLRPALRPLTRLGLRRAETVLHWLDPALGPWSAIELDDTGRTWIGQELPREAELVQRLLDEAAAAEPGARRRPAEARLRLAEALAAAERWEEAAKLFEELMEEADPQEVRQIDAARARALAPRRR